MAFIVASLRLGLRQLFVARKEGQEEARRRRQVARGVLARWRCRSHRRRRSLALAAGASRHRSRRGLVAWRVWKFQQPRVKRALRAGLSGLQRVSEGRARAASDAYAGQHWRQHITKQKAMALWRRALEYAEREAALGAAAARLHRHGLFKRWWRRSRDALLAAKLTTVASRHDRGRWVRIWGRFMAIRGRREASVERALRHHRWWQRSLGLVTLLKHRRESWMAAEPAWRARRHWLRRYALGWLAEVCVFFMNL